MSPDDIRDMIRLQPFVPFRLHMSNGMSVDVRHPEMVAVADESLAIETFSERRQKSFLKHYSVININVIEPLPAEENSTESGS